MSGRLGRGLFRFVAGFGVAGGPGLKANSSVLMCAIMKSAALVTFLFMTALSLSASPLQEIPLKTIDGKETTLKAYQGKVLLIVNVASRCGLTPQYKALQEVYEKYQDQGLEVLGFPCNQFAGQEPGSNEEIKQFCTANYHVTFPMFDKLEVNGAKRHPLYVALAGSGSPFPGDIEWNFGKFLIGRDGRIVKRFSPKTVPDSPEVTAAITAALAAK
jgi:glutathione peroxidase